VPDDGVFVEAPASALGEQEEVHEVVLAGGYVAVVLALEDVLIDRLHQFVAGGYRDVTSQAIALLGSDELNRERLEGRARDEGLESALQAIRDLAARTERDELIETWELREIAQQLQRER